MNIKYICFYLIIPTFFLSCLLILYCVYLPSFLLFVSVLFAIITAICFLCLFTDFLFCFSLAFYSPLSFLSGNAKLIITKAIKLASVNAVKKNINMTTHNKNNNKKWGRCESLSNNKLQLLLIWHVKSENPINEA